MKSCEGIGKTIEKAIENALLELKAPREDVDIKILEEGGLFKKAKVLVSISEDCIEKYERKTLASDDEVEEALDIKAIFADAPSLSEKEEKKENKEQQKQEKKEEKKEEKNFKETRSF